MWGSQQSDGKRGAQEAGLVERREQVLKGRGEANLKRSGRAKEVQHRQRLGVGVFRAGSFRRRQGSRTEPARAGTADGLEKWAGPAERFAEEAGPVGGRSQGGAEKLCGSPMEVGPAEEAGQGIPEPSGVEGTRGHSGSLITGIPPCPTRIPRLPRLSPDLSAVLARSGSFRAGGFGHRRRKGAFRGRKVDQRLEH